jgi:hypothetical protein
VLYRHDDADHAAQVRKDDLPLAGGGLVVVPLCQPAGLVA